MNGSGILIFIYYFVNLKKTVKKPLCFKGTLDSEPFFGNWMTVGESHVDLQLLPGVMEPRKPKSLDLRNAVHFFRLEVIKTLTITVPTRRLSRKNPRRIRNIPKCLFSGHFRVSYVCDESCRYFPRKPRHAPAFLSSFLKKTI